MKKGIFVLGVLMFILSLHAYAIPQSINFQGRLANPDGTPITSTESVTFKLFDDPSAGLEKGSYSTTVSPNSSGTFSVLLNFDPSSFDGGNRWLEVQVQTEILSPRQEIAAVPYAYRAITAESLSGGSVTQEADTLDSVLARGNASTGNASVGSLTVSGTSSASSIIMDNTSGVIQSKNVTTLAGQSLTIHAGDTTVNTSGRDGGSLTIRAGSPQGGGNEANGGALSISSGTGTGTGGNGGGITIQGGSGVSGGSISIQTGAGNTSGSVSIATGNGNPYGSGNITLQTGTKGTMGGSPGSILFNTSNMTRATIDGSGTTSFSGNVGIGTASPGASLEVVGQVKITGGAGSGKVLTSDGAGLASWQTAAGGGTVHTIGESYGGGKVFWVEAGGQHGLIAATADQNPSAMRWWAGTYTNTMALADGVGAGKANTALIIANQGLGDGAAYAARKCNEYAGGGYGDWYLPSKYELNLLYLQMGVVGGFLGYDAYWSSTQYDTNHAWGQDFADGNPGYQDNFVKNGNFGVRAIRAF